MVELRDDDIVISRSNEVSMSQEDEAEAAAAAEDQERQVKRRRITCQSGCEQREMKLQISCLPIDVLYCVLDKLLELVDYVRFAAVCKELQQVANLYNITKQRWVSKPKLLPMLMLPPKDSSSEPQTKPRLLYSVSERKIYNNINICSTVPNNEKFCGSSQGWLASALRSTIIEEEGPEIRKSSLVHEITLRNPFGKASEVIHLPPYMIRLKRFNDHRIEWIPRILLSADPVLHPENYYVLFALFRPLATCIGYRYSARSPPLLLLKGGEQSWITINQIPSALMFDDATFHKNKFCLLLDWGHEIVTLDVNSITTNPSQLKIQYLRFEPNPRDIFPYCWERYLVESTNGDLLLVLRFFMFKKTSFAVCKIVFDEEDETTVELVEVKCVGDDAIFLGQSQSQSVLASSVPGCKPNCIYYATESVKRNECPSTCDHLKSEMGVFNLGVEPGQH